MWDDLKYYGIYADIGPLTVLGWIVVLMMLAITAASIKYLVS